jgi:hypothetical protein
MGLTMELTELIRLFRDSGPQKNAREFLGRNGYKIGDVGNRRCVSRTEIYKLRSEEGQQYE